MDLLSLLRTLRRHMFLTTVVFMLTAAGAYYIIKVAQPTYETSASYILIAPPAPPTQLDLQTHPELAGVNYQNPFTRLYDQSIVVDVVARAVNSEASRKALIEAGADDRFTLAPSARYGTASPIVDINGFGATPAIAENTARLVSDAFVRQLEQMQKDESVDERYMFRARVIDFPNDARLQVSSKLRSLVGVMGLGAFALFILVSTAEAVRQSRMERRPAARPGGITPPTPADWIPRSLRGDGDQDRPMGVA
jgi:capsular polysaccharide biosynthesis protein